MKVFSRNGKYYLTAKKSEVAAVLSKKASPYGECDWWIVNDQGVVGGPFCEDKAFLMYDGRKGEVTVRAATEQAAVVKYRQMMMGEVAAGARPNGWLRTAMGKKGEPA